MHQSKPFARRGPTAAESRILELLLQHRYLTKDLIVQAYSLLHGRGAHTVPAYLTRLRRKGWITPFYRMNNPARNEFVYVISAKGARQILTPRNYRLVRRKIYNLNRPKSSFEHALRLSIINLLWQLGGAAVGDVFKTVWHWDDREGGRMNDINKFHLRYKGELESIEPDHTYLIDHRRGGFYRPYLVQYEHTRKNYERLRDHFRMVTFLLAGTRATDEVRSVFLRNTGIEPARAFAIYITDDDYSARTLQKLAMAMAYESGWKTRQWPRVFFSSMDRFTTKDYLRDKRGVPIERHGRPVRVERLIRPSDFFTRQMFFDLRGRPRHLVHADP